MFFFPFFVCFSCVGHAKGVSPPPYVSVNSNWVHPPRDELKKLPGGSGFDFRKLPGGREFDKGGDFVEIQSETFCLYVGFISDKYRVSQELLKNGEHYIVDFQFKLRQTPYKCVIRNMRHPV